VHQPTGVMGGQDRHATRPHLAERGGRFVLLRIRRARRPCGPKCLGGSAEVLRSFGADAGLSPAGHCRQRRRRCEIRDRLDAATGRSSWYCRDDTARRTRRHKSGHRAQGGLVRTSTRGGGRRWALRRTRAGLRPGRSGCSFGTALKWSAALAWRRAASSSSFNFKNRSFSATEPDSVTFRAVISRAGRSISRAFSYDDLPGVRRGPHRLRAHARRCYAKIHARSTYNTTRMRRPRCYPANSYAVEAEERSDARQ